MSALKSGKGEKGTPIVGCSLKKGRQGDGPEGEAFCKRGKRVKKKMENRLLWGGFRRAGDRPRKVKGKGGKRKSVIKKNTRKGGEGKGLAQEKNGPDSRARLFLGWQRAMKKGKRRGWTDKGQ